MVVIMSYFSFTTVSTVGFGDYSPRSDSERILFIPILLFGVSIFSIIMGEFSVILMSFNTLNAELDESADLDRFIGMLNRFNGKEKLPYELR
jgi:hypothetical protein